jgi:hypothetical protein
VSAESTDLMTTAEAAEYLRLSYNYMEKLRLAKQGPQYLQPTPRGRVLYRRQDLDGWLAGRKKPRKRAVLGSGVQIEHGILRRAVGDVWEAHIGARGRFFVRQNGSLPPAPLFSASLYAAIEEALKKHDAALLLPAVGSERWRRESAVRAAGIGIFYDPWCTGTHRDNDVNNGGKRYLEPERCWVQQRGKPDPVTRFSQLYFERRAYKEVAAGKAEPLEVEG